MRQKAGTQKASAEQVAKDIRRATRKQYGAEEKIRIVLEGLRDEDSIAALCRREGIAESLYYSWSKEFLEAGKRRLTGDTARAATTDEVKALRQEARTLKEVVAEQALELRLLKKTRPAKPAGRLSARVRRGMPRDCAETGCARFAPGAVYRTCAGGRPTASDWRGRVRGPWADAAGLLMAAITRISPRNTMVGEA